MRLARSRHRQGVRSPSQTSAGAKAERNRAPVTAQTVVALTAPLAFVVVLALVVSAWSPLRSADGAAVDAANALVAPAPEAIGALRLVTELGGARTAIVLLSLAVIWLSVRRSFRLATYVAVTGLGLAALDPGVKALVARARPMVDIPVPSAPGGSFPSGHAMTSIVTCGVLLLVFLPAIPSRRRRPAIAIAAAIVVIVGISRVSLGLHYPSDIVAGWLLGLLWLSVTTAAFRARRAQENCRTAPLLDGIAPEEAPRLQPAPAPDHPLPAGWRSGSQLLVAAVLLWGALVGLGFAITDLLPSVRRLDRQVADWFVGIRSEELTALLSFVGRLGSTGVVVSIIALGVVVALATTRRSAPALFLLFAATGQSVLYFAASRVIGRLRPSFERLATTELPAQASFPSGHVAATVATYGAIALLVVAWTRPKVRYAAVAFAVIATLSVAISRVYLAVHYATDTLVSLSYATVWVTVCWHVLRPERGSPADDRDSEGTTHGRRPGSRASGPTP